MACKGVNSDAQVWFATLSSSLTIESWSAQGPNPDASTSHGPGLVGWNGRLFLFWKAAASSLIFFSVPSAASDAHLGHPSRCNPDFKTERCCSPSAPMLPNQQ